MLLPDQCNAQSFTLPGGLFQHAGLDHCSGTVSLAYRRGECGLSVEGRARANHAVAAEHPGLDKLPAAEAHNERNDSAVRKIYALDRVLGFEDDDFSRGRQLLEMREDQVAVGG